MEPYHAEKKANYESIADSLDLASALYRKAAGAISAEEGYHEYYSYIKEANQLIDECFPEKRTIHAPKPLMNTSQGGDWQIFVRLIIPITFFLLMLLYFVLSGTTGDMTKTWNMDDVKKNTIYPKND